VSDLTQPAKAQPKLVGAVGSRQPAYRNERPIGPHLTIDRGLRGGKLDVVPLTCRDLIHLIRSASVALERELEMLREDVLPDA
jgi:hypothetical protein